MINVYLSTIRTFEHSRAYSMWYSLSAYAHIKAETVMCWCTSWGDDDYILSNFCLYPIVIVQVNVVWIEQDVDLLVYLLTISCCEWFVVVAYVPIFIKLEKYTEVIVLMQVCFLEVVLHCSWHIVDAVDIQEVPNNASCESTLCGLKQGLHLLVLST